MQEFWNQQLQQQQQLPQMVMPPAQNGVYQQYAQKKEKPIVVKDDSIKVFQKTVAKKNETLPVAAKVKVVEPTVANKTPATVVQKPPQKP